MRNHTKIALGLAAAAALVAAGCGDKNRSASTIAQPVVEGLPVAPESERVDLASPTFSDPTNVTQPAVPGLAAGVGAAARARSTASRSGPR